MYKLFHVSPAYNDDSIMSSHIDPLRSRGKRKVIWLVDHSQLMWALSHTSSRWDVPVSRLSVHEVYVTAPQISRTCWTGVFTCGQPIVPELTQAATEYLSPVP